MAVFSVRAWLARELGCDPTQLTLLDASVDGRDAIFALEAEPYAQVHLLGESLTLPNRASGVVAAWPGGSANKALRRSIDIEW